MGFRLNVIGGLLLVAGGTGVAYMLGGDGKPVLPSPVAAITEMQSDKGVKVRAVGVRDDGDLSNALCNVTFLAEEKDGKIVNDISVDFGVASSPIKIGEGVYNILLKGDACKKAADMPGYLGSTLKEYLALDPKIQARFLKVAGECADEKTGKKYSCSVPVGDPGATVGAKPFFPHGWQGRDDLQIEDSKELSNATP